MKPPIQSPVSTATIDDSCSHRAGRLGVHFRAKRKDEQRRAIIAPHDGGYPAAWPGDAYEFSQHPVGIAFLHDGN